MQYITQKPIAVRYEEVIDYSAIGILKEVAIDTINHFLQEWQNQSTYLGYFRKAYGIKTNRGWEEVKLGDFIIYTEFGNRVYSPEEFRIMFGTTDNSSLPKG